MVWARVRLLEVSLRAWKRKAEYRWRHYREWKQRGDRAHYWLDQNEKHHNAAGVASDRLQIERLSPLVHKWEHKWAEANAKVHLRAAEIAKLKPKPPPVPQGEGWSVPATGWNPYRRKLANWIVRELHDAVARGAQGHVNSGVRTYSEQKRLYENYLNGGNIAARPGYSNHEGYVKPRGAVDWSNPESLEAALRRKPHRELTWAEDVGLHDTVHFSRYGR